VRRNPHSTRTGSTHPQKAFAGRKIGDFLKDVLNFLVRTEKTRLAPGKPAANSPGSPQSRLEHCSITHSGTKKKQPSEVCFQVLEKLPIADGRP